MKNTRVFLTVNQVAEMLHVNRITVNEYVKKGYLKRYGIGRRVLFDENEVIEAISQLR